jgi:TatD DNase family protein
LDNFENVFFGFTGVLTYESATQIQKAVKDVVPLERILLETDGPYMPASTGGKKGKNEISHCGHIPLIAAKIAELKQVSVDEVLTRCRQNTMEMYGI